MICDPCIEGGEYNRLNQIKLSEAHHEQCEGCLCQHKTGPGWVLRKGSKAPLMQTQSP